MGKDVLFSHHLEPRKKKKEKKNWQRETPIMEIGKCEYHPSYFWTNQTLELIRSRSRSAPVRSWFLERSANFYSSLLRENSTDAIKKITFCIFWFENLVCGLDWDVRTSQELDFRLITTTTKLIAWNSHIPPNALRLPLCSVIFSCPVGGGGTPL